MISGPACHGGLLCALDGQTPRMLGLVQNRCHHQLTLVYFSTAGWFQAEVLFQSLSLRNGRKAEFFLAALGQNVSPPG